jgi:hypothetical protein
MGLKDQSTATLLPGNQPARRAGSRTTLFLTVILVAAALVGSISLITNRMAARWDMWYYRDMAINGLSGNPHLATPFAYRPIVPLTIYAISHTLHTDPEATFHVAVHVIAVVLLVLAFYWTRSFGASERASWCGMLALAPNFVMIRYPLLTGTMIDIYAYVWILIASWFLFRRRFAAVLLFCGIGLFLKEFMVVPILTQAAVLLWETPRRRWLSLWRPIGISAFVVVFYIAVTRLTIPVYESFDHIDRRHPETLWFFVTHPLSPKRWFNIIYSFLSLWLPVLLLMTRERWRMVREQLAPYGTAIGFYLFFQLVLLMYGGNNIFIFAGYSLPLLLLVMWVIVDRGSPQLWEIILVFLVIAGFNRIGEHIPTYDEGRWDALNEFYGGFGVEIGLRSVLRFIEIWFYFSIFQVLRIVAGRASAVSRASIAR